METGEMISASAMLVVFAFATIRGRRVWMLTDAGAVVLFGLGWIVAPRIFFEQMTNGPLDEVHIFFARWYGAALIASAVAHFMTRNSGDVTVSNVLLYSRVVGITMTLLAVAYCQMNYRDLEKGGWTQQQIFYGVFGNAVWLLGNLYHSTRTDQYGCFSQRNDRVSFVLRIDGFFCLVTGVLGFAFPDMALSFMGLTSPDGIHLHMVRCFNAVVFMFGLMSTWAPVFLKDEDKRNVLLGRMVADFLLVAVGLLQIQTLNSPTYLYTHVSNFLYACFLTWGYLAPAEKKTA